MLSTKSIVKRLNLYYEIKSNNNVILEQLGGNKFIAMTGAKNFVTDANSLKFNIPKNKSGCNTVTIKINGKDLYDMTFYTYRNLELKPKVKKTDVDVANLRKVFEDVTQLRTSLN
jgi:hypothetical protein